MSFFNFFSINLILILFPILVGLVLIICFSNFNDEKKKVLIDIAIITSSYFTIRYNIYCHSYALLLVNLPFLMALLNKRKVPILIISMLLCYYYSLVFSVSIYVIAIEYLIYIIVFSFLIKKKNFSISIFLFTIIKSIMLYAFLDGVNLMFIDKIKFLYLVILFLITAFVIYILIRKSYNSISINSAITTIEKEKNLRNSLFKITHEVKNPLAVCKGYISMMDINDKQKTKKYLEIIKSEIDTTLDILDNFSLYTKIVIKKEKMDLSELINNTCSSLNELIINKKITIEKEVIDNSLIYGDYNRLKQVFINILKNSIESISSSGVIKIVLKDSKNKYILSISDNGCGMSKDVLDNLGKIFFTTKEKGTGIGVLLCKEIINEHGGNIKYNSKEGIGTVVTIVFDKYK